MSDVETYEEVGAGTALSTPHQCSSLRKGGHVLLKGRACKIVEMKTSKTGKHGHAKVHMVGVDIFTGRKYEDICPSTHNMDVPVIERVEYQLLNVEDDDFMSLMQDNGDTKDDLRVPDGEIGAQIKSAFEEGRDLICCVLTAMNEETVVSVRESTK